MSVSTKMHTIRGTSIPLRHGPDHYSLQRQRRSDRQWWHSWMTRPIRRLFQSINTIEFFELLFLIICVVSLLMLGFIILMAILAATGAGLGLL